MNKILQFCEKTGFVRANYSGKSIDFLAFGPTGEHLVNNLRNEWIYSCVTSSCSNVFPFYRNSSASTNISQDIKDSYSFVKRLCKGQLPFTLAEIRQQCEKIDPSIGIANEAKTKDNAFNISKGTILRTIQFWSPEEANRSFTTLQRERKTWWTKFSSSPGRFKLSEVISTDGAVNGFDLKGQSLQSVQILSDFDWGTGVVETVRLWPPSTFETKEKVFELHEEKDSLLPCALESILILDVAALVYLCDAFDNKTVEDVIMRLHRRIAPFKVSFASSVSRDLLPKAHALAEYATELLRKAGHTTLLLPKIGEEPLEAALDSYNQLGVPFTVVLSDSSLTDGILFLYSRETALKEQIHISQLVSYMNQLLSSST